MGIASVNAIAACKPNRDMIRPPRARAIAIKSPPIMNDDATTRANQAQGNSHINAFADPSICAAIPAPHDSSSGAEVTVTTSKRLARRAQPGRVNCELRSVIRPCVTIMDRIGASVLHRTTPATLVFSPLREMLLWVVIN
jgi:hypothetical protein